MIRTRRRAGFKLIEMVVVMGILAAMIGFWGQVFVSLQRNAGRQQTQATGGTAVELMLSQLRADLQSARRAAVSARAVDGEQGLVLLAADNDEHIVYRYRSQEGIMFREAGDRRIFRLPRGTSVSFDTANPRLVAVRVEGTQPGFRHDAPLQATMVAALRSR